MDGTMRLPLARTEGLVTEELAEELLVYDLNSDHAHALGATTAQVWRRCDGTATVRAVADELDLSADEVNQAVEELDRCKLLAVPVSANGGMSRRDFGFRVAKVGAAAASVPLIVSITAPTAAQAQTPCPTGTIQGCGPCNLVGQTTSCCCCHAGTTGNPPFRCNQTTQECCCTPTGIAGVSASHCTEAGVKRDCSTITCP